MEIEDKIRSMAPELTKTIQKAASQAANEAELRTKITQAIQSVADNLNLDLALKEERTLVNGRADAVYSRLVIEYEPPRSLREDNRHGTNQHAIGQLKGYIEGLVKKERHKPERLAGVVLDGSYFIFIRNREGVWQIDSPLRVDGYSTEYFLKLLSSLSTEHALIPQNLVRDFGENTDVSRKVVGSLFRALTSTTNAKVKTLFNQWSLQFSEVCDYEEASKLKVESFADKFGIGGQKMPPFQFFFTLHTYYAAFIKLLAVQVVQYYAMPRLGTDLKKAATSGCQELRAYLGKMEEGGIFRELGLSNFMEGDFFGWYLEVWDDNLYQAFKALISALANYSLVTLDVDPDTTRDLLKKLYQQLMPKELRHNLGEYYTPDWLAERLLNMLEGGKFEGNPDKRLLDPACGSGTFLVIAIKRIREYAWANALPESQVLEKVLSNVVGFDLSPLAVISARTNYLLALGDLIRHRRGEINVPVYLCDSIMTPQEGEDLFGKGVLKFNTAVGPLSLPKSLVQTNYIDILSDFLEEAVKLNLSRAQFVEKLCQKLPVDQARDEKDIDVVHRLYEKLLSLDRQGINGIWARIIKNAFAPLFVGEFDYVAGNPPWVNWESLPEQYRLETKPLWVHYGLFPHGGMDTILGKGKKDISMIMTYVAMDKYLRKDGKLGFLITQSVFKTAGAGQGFRRFRLGEAGAPIQVVHVDDMMELNPFEGASNRTSAVILQKGKPTKYPMRSYLYWRKTAKGKSIPLEATLDEVLGMTERKQFFAEPVSDRDATSPWMTGRPKALRAIRKVLGQSGYTAHAGCYTGGVNAVYWVEVVTIRPDGLFLVSNITEGAKKKVESVQTAIEPDLLYPLLRGRDVNRWRAEPSAYIIMAQDPVKRRGIAEDEMKTQHPKTYMYLKKTEGILRERAAFKRYFTRKDKSGKITETGPFYSMFNVSHYTFAPYKVVWREQASSLTAAAVSTIEGKTAIPDHKLMLVGCDAPQEAYYLSGVLNSAAPRFAASSYAVQIQFDTHLLENICIPQFDPKSTLHLRLAELSENAHNAAKKGDLKSIQAAEDEIDLLSAEIWRLSPEELKEIKANLKEMSE
jgi:SAM-dependent methyltransferase